MGRAFRLNQVRVVVLAGGRGTRLYPYTAVVPKPLVPVGDMPILEILVRQLRRAGFRQLIFAVGHLHHLIQAYFGDGRRWGVRIAYHHETRLLGTIGVLGQLGPWSGPTLLVNGDILTTLKFRELVTHHLRRGNVLTLALNRRTIPIDFGVVDSAAQGRILAYREKPQLAHWVSTGIAVCAPGVRRWMRRGECWNLPELVQRLIADQAPVEAVRARAFWLDIGRPDDYSKAQQLFARHPQRFISARGA